MEYLPESNDLNDYLAADYYIDFDNPPIQKKAGELFADLPDDNEKIKAAFEFVRDEIDHSADIDSERVTKRASEVLKHKEGICFSKSLLLAALLRYAKIPAGLCYQRLTKEETPDSGYVLHGLNAVYLSDKKKWLRIDARGNKLNVDAQFTGEREKIAFLVRHEYKEIDYPTIYAAPHPLIMQAFEKYNNRKYQDFGINEL
jgi:transglutaminase-like putative cysteine protease